METAYIILYGYITLWGIAWGVLGVLSLIGRASSNADFYSIYFYAVWPGVGQMKNGERKKGIVLITGFLLSFVPFAIYYLLIIREIVFSGVPFLVLFPIWSLIQIYSYIDAVFIGCKKGEYRVSDAEEAQLQKILWADGSEPNGDKRPPVPEGGFQRKVKGEVRFKSLPPLPDEEQESKSKD